MKRRNFFRLLASGTGAALISGTAYKNRKDIALHDAKNIELSELDKHAITRIDFTDVELKYPRQVGKNAQLDIHGTGPRIRVGILHTDRGAMGWGMLQARGKRMEQAAEYISGKRITEIFKPAIGITDQKAYPFDIALHDLSGMILGKPVYEFLGRTSPFITNCYSGMIYFDDLEPKENPAGPDKILEECQYDYNVGYRQFKLKIGRGNKWMPAAKGMKRDIEITRMVAEHFPDCDILVDANNGYTVGDTIAYIEGIGDTRLFWFEEPFHETYKDYLKLRKWLLDNGVETFLADGEANPDQNLLKDLYEKRILDVHLTDIVGYGFTPWRQLMPELVEMGISASPHAWGSLFKTHYIAHLAGGLGNTPTIEGVTCESDDVDFGNYKLEEGKLTPSSDPGFGMKLLKDL